MRLAARHGCTTRPYPGMRLLWPRHGPCWKRHLTAAWGLLVNTLIQQNSLTQSDLDGLYEILRQAEEGEEGTK